MGNRAEQLAALGQITADTLAHVVEGTADLDDLAGTDLGQRTHFASHRELPRRLGQALQWPALPAHQQADEQQQEGAGQHDEPQLLHRQPLVFQADVGCRHQRGEIEPFLRRDLDLRHQHRWRQWFEAQRVVGPGARQLLELDAAVEDAQIVRADELDGQVHRATQTLAQHLLHLVQHRTLAWRLRQDLHLQRLVVERDEEARAAHAAQLVEHQRSVAQRQRSEVADARPHRLRQAAGAGQQPFHLAGAQLR